MLDGFTHQLRQPIFASPFPGRAIGWVLCEFMGSMDVEQWLQTLLWKPASRVFAGASGRFCFPGAVVVFLRVSKSAVVCSMASLSVGLLDRQ
jgi:hypothetical protein